MRRQRRFRSRQTCVELYGEPLESRLVLSASAVGPLPPPPPLFAPNALVLDPVSDTGRSSQDHITSDDTPRLVVDVDVAALQGTTLLTPEQFSEGTVEGVAVVVVVTDLFTGDRIEQVATRVGSSQLFEADPELPDGRYLAYAQLRSVEPSGSDDPPTIVSGPTSHAISLTVDTRQPLGSPASLPSASDTGASGTDRVTSMSEPFFVGIGDEEVRVQLFANGELVGETLTGFDGRWEITSEPLKDGVYDISVRYEDVAGNVFEVATVITIEIDTQAPNVPRIDLVEATDTGRHNDDNITAAELLDFVLTTHDANPQFHTRLFPGGQNLRYLLYVRPEEGTETLIYDSATDGSLGDLLHGLTAEQRVSVNGIVLDEGLHNLKLDVVDRAGNVSHAFLLDLLVDRTPPEGQGRLHPASDSGIEGYPSTMTDRITNHPAPRFTGTSEANAVVEVRVDGQPVGTGVAVPLSGDEAFPQPPGSSGEGNWVVESAIGLADGEHQVEFQYEDLAGNRGTSTTTIFVDTQGPRITNITRPDEPETSVFAPKPDSGPDPLLTSLLIHFTDGPNRTDAFTYPALWPPLAIEEGNYRLIGDAHGEIAIREAQIVLNHPGPGPARMQVALHFDEPLPDDRYTLIIDDRLRDPAGNRLDGESRAAAPFPGQDGDLPTPPVFPTGDGTPGGQFTARFTVDSRPELGVWAAGSVWIDLNGNWMFDPEYPDVVHRDIVYTMGMTSDDVFAGNFARADQTADGFDKLAAYGRFNGQFRWLVDLDSDGVPDIHQPDPRNINALPVAGRFDDNDQNGDEVGLFDGRTWYFDTNHDFQVDLELRSQMTGYPIIGDFDGDGFDDLATWTDDRFQIDLANGTRRGWDGQVDVAFRFGFIGVRERPVAADMDQDGFDDLGLWTPDRDGVMHDRHSEWYFLISDGNSLLDRVQPAIDPIRDLPIIPFTPWPFGADLYARFGDQFALPIVGNFDPPVTASAAPSEPSGGESGSGASDGELPLEETPGQETPVGETPGEETLPGEAPAEETPVGETPAEETSSDEPPTEESPGDELGSGPSGELPSETEPPIDPAAENDPPKDESPEDGLPEDGVPEDGVPEDQQPEENSPEDGTGEPAVERDPHDVNGDGFVSPLDAAWIITVLNRQNQQAAEGEAGEGAEAAPPAGALGIARPDVNGDGHVSPADAMAVIVALNKQNAAAQSTAPPPGLEHPSENESDGAAVPDPPVTSQVRQALHVDLALAQWTNNTTRRGSRQGR